MFRRKIVEKPEEHRRLVVEEGSFWRGDRDLRNSSRAESSRRYAGYDSKSSPAKESDDFNGMNLKVLSPNVYSQKLFPDVVNDLNSIRAEREKIEREKEAILRQQEEIRFSLPQPVSSSSSRSSRLPEPVSSDRGRERKKRSGSPSKDKGIQFSLNRRKTVSSKWDVETDSGEEDQDGIKGALDTVLDAVGPSKKAREDETAKRILPGAKSFADIEKYIMAAKKEKLDRLKKTNKDYKRDRY